MKNHSLFGYAELDAKEKEILALQRQLAKARKGMSKRINGASIHLPHAIHYSFILTTVALTGSRDRCRARK